MVLGQGGHMDGAPQGEFEGDREGSEKEVVDSDNGVTVKNKKKGSLDGVLLRIYAYAIHGRPSTLTLSPAPNNHSKPIGG
jgi:hypothetical protein